ncbi:MAG: DinB family protein [Candidatus Thorarchaeota archaeon]
MVESIADYAKWSLTNHLKVLRKMICLVPDDKIQFRPTPEQKSVSEIVHHVLSATQTHIFAVRDGVGRQEHSTVKGMDPGTLKSTSELLAHMDGVSDTVGRVMGEITPEQLDAAITYTQWNDYTVDARRSLLFFIEELIHHRGQISVYLRLLGIAPPHLYDYS